MNIASLRPLHKRGLDTQPFQGPSFKYGHGEGQRYRIPVGIDRDDANLAIAVQEYGGMGNLRFEGADKIQTVEDMYQLIWTAIANKQPISGMYKDLPRLFCPHRLDRNRLGEPRVLCYQDGGESESGLGPIGSPENWRCVVFEKLRRAEVLNGSWKTAPNHSRPATCVVDADIDAEDQPEREPQLGQ